MKKIRIPSLKTFKENKQKIVCITAYDSSSARVVDEAGIELILVGDSLGMVIQGHNSTVPVTTDDIVYHCKAVTRGAKNAIITADMPFMSYSSQELAVKNVTKLMQAGAEMIKIEGGKELAPLIDMLTTQGVPVCGHLGLQPQFLHKRGGFKAIPNSEETLSFLMEETRILVDAGIDCLLLECVPSEISKKITESFQIPVIGIGSGKHCDGQILVFHDVVGLTKSAPPFSKNFLNGETGGISSALSHYVNDVKTGLFPV
jgi:3-methyl-2-oxobutanoate hydroxymethyltransferase